MLMNHVERVQWVASLFPPVEWEYLGATQHDPLVRIHKLGVTAGGQDTIRCSCDAGTNKSMLPKKPVEQLPLGVFLDRLGEEFDDPDLFKYVEPFKPRTSNYDRHVEQVGRHQQWDVVVTLPYEEGPRLEDETLMKELGVLQERVVNPDFKINVAPSLVRGMTAIPRWVNNVGSISAVSQSKKYRAGERIRNGTDWKAKKRAYYFVSSYRSRSNMGMFVLLRDDGELIASASIDKWGKEVDRD